MDSIKVDLQSLLEMQQYLLVNTESKTDWHSDVIACLTFLVTLFTLILAWAAFVYTKREYSLHLAKEQADTLSQYNQRYSSDENIAAVIQYFISKEESSQSLTIPSIFAKEMFLRFFEELQYAIEQKSISKDMAYEMFSWYAIKAYDEGQFFVDDMFEDCWRRFCTFAKEMKRIKKQKDKKCFLKRI